MHGAAKIYHDCRDSLYFWVQKAASRHMIGHVLARMMDAGV